MPILSLCPQCQSCVCAHSADPVGCASVRKGTFTWTVAIRVATGVSRFPEGTSREAFFKSLKRSCQGRRCYMTPSGPIGPPPTDSGTDRWCCSRCGGSCPGECGHRNLASLLSDLLGLPPRITTPGTEYNPDYQCRGGSGKQHSRQRTRLASVGISAFFRAQSPLAVLCARQSARHVAKDFSNTDSFNRQPRQNHFWPQHGGKWPAADE